MKTFAPKGNIFGPILPQFILEMPLSLGAKVMYALLCNYASDKDHCWPSQKTLATRLACSVSSIKNYLAELVRERLIEVRHENYRSSVYYILQPEALRKGAAPAGDQPKSDSGQPESGHINNLSKQQEEKNTPLPPMKPERKDALSSSAPSAGGVGSAELDFETAWESYPRKEAKGFARMAWFKLLRSGQLPSLQELLSAIARSSASESWQKEQGRFIPQMANWLRGQRWLDSSLPVSPCVPAPDPRVRQFMRQKEEQEQLELSRQCREKERLRPLFQAFAAKFDAPDNEAMAFGIWMHLHSLRCAPSAADVPETAGRDIMAFLRERKRQAQEERYLVSLRKKPVSQSHSVEPVPCEKSVASFATVTACA